MYSCDVIIVLSNGSFIYISKNELHLFQCQNLMKLYSIWSLFNWYHNNKISIRFALFACFLVACTWIFVSIFWIRLGGNKEENCGFRCWDEEINTHGTVFFDFPSTSFEVSLFNFLTVGKMLFFMKKRKSKKVDKKSQ